MYASMVSKNYDSQPIQGGDSGVPPLAPERIMPASRSGQHLFVGGQRQHNLERGSPQRKYEARLQLLSERTGVISWRDATPRGAATSVVEHGKVWANSRPRVGLRDVPRPLDSKECRRQ
jgi:hypothetical protein